MGFTLSSFLCEFLLLISFFLIFIYLLFSAKHAISICRTISSSHFFPFWLKDHLISALSDVPPQKVNWKSQKSLLLFQPISRPIFGQIWSNLLDKGLQFVGKNLNWRMTFNKSNHSCIDLMITSFVLVWNYWEVKPSGNILGCQLSKHDN